MRTWLYNRIKAMAGIPAAFGAGPMLRLISSGAADQEQPPFLLVSMGVEQTFPGIPKSMGAQTIPFTVWVHDSPGSMLNIDNAAQALKDNLPLPNGAVVGGMSIYELVWVETGQDSYDDFYKTNCRPVRFVMTTAR